MLPQQNRIMKVVEKIFKGFWKSHLKTLGLLVNSLIVSERAGVCVLGRYLSVNTSPKHAIKRVDYFLGNDHVDTLKACECLMAWLIVSRTQLVISVDWTKYRRWSVLVASIMYQGRSLPIFLAVMNQPWLTKSVNTFENTFLRLLRMMIPKTVKVILLMDRGFRRVSLLKHLTELDFYYVIRVCGKTHVRTKTYTGPLNHLIHRGGKCKDLGEVGLTKGKPFPTRLVVCWDSEQKEPWLLATNLDLPKRMIVKLYGKRFQIEECFRDQKCYRFGYGLGNVLMKKPDHLERLILVVVVSQLLTMVLGVMVQQRNLLKGFSVNTLKQRKVYSDFMVGNYYILRIAWTIAELSKTLANMMETTYEKF